ncbi:MAG: hypothetical protein QOE92_418, partial [Chloroflexota bacterium]|nr:hypothetical protein [Chloroflexota bacterium]
MVGQAGIGRFSEGLWQGLVSRGADVVGLVPAREDGWRGDATAPPGPTVVVRSRPFGVAEQVEVPRVVTRIGAGVYHSAHLTVPHLRRGPVVLTVHDLFPVKWPRHARSRAAAMYYRAAFPLALGRADAVVAVSPYTARMIQEVLPVPPAKLHMVEHGIDHDRWRPAPEAEIEAALAALGLQRPYVLYSGTAKWHKNLPVLLDAYRGDLPALVMAGPTSEEVAAAAPGIENPLVRPLGRVASDLLPAVYSGATALVLPSLHESVGFTALEAMACGVPVVASTGGCLPETVGDAGVLVPADDVAGWRES